MLDTIHIKYVFNSKGAQPLENVPQKEKVDKWTRPSSLLEDNCCATWLSWHFRGVSQHFQTTTKKPNSNCSFTIYSFSFHVSLLVYNVQIKTEKLKNFWMTQTATRLRASYKDCYVSDQPGHWVVLKTLLIPIFWKSFGISVFRNMRKKDLGLRFWAQYHSVSLLRTKWNFCCVFNQARFIFRSNIWNWLAGQL
jgi:hypothetical protein